MMTLMFLFTTLVLLQIEVTTGALTNLALNKPAYQVSTYYSVYNHVAGWAVDGNSNPIADSGSCSHTDDAINPWWVVDLEENYPIAEVWITNRADCCSERLHDVEITVGSAYAGNGDLIDPVSCATVSGEFSAGKTIVSCSSGVSGSVVKIQVISTTAQSLTLCQVKVYAASPNNIALNKPATQIAGAHAAPASRAVTDNTSPNFSDDGCSHTAIRTDPWWIVDLEAEYNIEYLDITNRQDCCSDRLHDVVITVGTSDEGSGVLGNPTACASISGVLAAGETTITCASAAYGRYLKIMVTGASEQFSLCDVSIFPEVKDCNCEGDEYAVLEQEDCSSDDELCYFDRNICGTGANSAVTYIIHVGYGDMCQETSVCCTVWGPDGSETGVAQTEKCSTITVDPTEKEDITFPNVPWGCDSGPLRPRVSCYNTEGTECTYTFSFEDYV